jgi:methylmalonyl-CoA mutase N-terminal domain/subunit
MRRVADRIRLAADADQYLTVAKFRALRVLWGASKRSAA